MGDREVAFELLARLKEEEALSSVLVHCYDYPGQDIPNITGKGVPGMNFIEYHARQAFDGRRRDRRDGVFVGPRLHGVAFNVPLPTQQQIDEAHDVREARLFVARQEREARKARGKIEEASRRAAMIRELGASMPAADCPVRYNISIVDGNGRRAAGLPVTHTIGSYVLGCRVCDQKHYTRLHDLLILPCETRGTDDSVFIPIGCIGCGTSWLQPVPTAMLGGSVGWQSDCSLIVERIES